MWDIINKRPLRGLFKDDEYGYLVRRWRGGSKIQKNIMLSFKQSYRFFVKVTTSQQVVQLSLGCLHDLSYSGLHYTLCGIHRLREGVSSLFSFLL